MTNPIPALGVIGGSGLYNISALQDTEEIDLDTPFGKPSSPIMLGTLSGKRVAFLARHGIGHYISPSEINFRANIYAMKQLGVPRIISVSACGSLREDYEPGHLVVPDQLFDFTRDRQRSFFDNGVVAHVGVADPFCGDLSEQLVGAARSAGATVHTGGTFITIEGPRFSTRAESSAYRAWGMSIIGMTTCPEAFLAREAEICYGVLAHVTDYDVWHISEEPVSVEMVIRVLNQNTAIAQQALQNLVLALDALGECTSCPSAMATAQITDPAKIPAETRQRIALLIGRYLPGSDG